MISSVRSGDESVQADLLLFFFRETGRFGVRRVEGLWQSQTFIRVCAQRGVAYPGPGRRAWRGRDEGSGDVDELPSAGRQHRSDTGYGRGGDRHLVCFSSCREARCQGYV
jgi:hypothetical protein